jgi:ABC-type amino acid transport system permease subunit
MINRTSKAIEGTVIIIVVYLAINLTISWVMNQINRSFEKA